MSLERAEQPIALMQQAMQQASSSSERHSREGPQLEAAAYRSDAAGDIHVLILLITGTTVLLYSSRREIHGDARIL
jgi:hypothetical protein